MKNLENYYKQCMFCHNICILKQWPYRSFTVQYKSVFITIKILSAKRNSRDMCCIVPLPPISLNWLILQDLRQFPITQIFDNIGAHNHTNIMNKVSGHGLKDFFLVIPTYIQCLFENSRYRGHKPLPRIVLYFSRFSLM